MNLICSIKVKVIAGDLHLSISNNDFAIRWIISSEESDRVNKLLWLTKLATVLIHEDEEGAAIAAFSVPSFENEEEASVLSTDHLELVAARQVVGLPMRARGMMAEGGTWVIAAVRACVPGRRTCYRGPASTSKPSGRLDLRCVDATGATLAHAAPGGRCW